MPICFFFCSFYWRPKVYQLLTLSARVTKAKYNSNYFGQQHPMLVRQPNQKCVRANLLLAILSFWHLPSTYWSNFEKFSKWQMEIFSFSASSSSSLSRSIPITGYLRPWAIDKNMKESQRIENHLQIFQGIWNFRSNKKKRLVLSQRPFEIFLIFFNF